MRRGASPPSSSACAPLLLFFFLLSFCFGFFDDAGSCWVCCFPGCVCGNNGYEAATEGWYGYYRLFCVRLF